MKTFIIDGYNKTLFKNVISILLKNNAYHNYIIIDIDDFIKIKNNLPLNITSFLNIDKLKNKIINIDQNKIEFLIIISSSFLEKKIQDYIKNDTILSYYIPHFHFFYIHDQQNIFSMNIFYCSLRIKQSSFFQYFYKPLFFMLYNNYKRCQNIESYYDNINYSATHHYLFQNVIETIFDKMKIKYDFNYIIKLIKNKVNVIFWSGIFLIILKILFYIIFYLPTFIYHKSFFYSINQIKKKPILIIPALSLIIESYYILFIPEIYNLYCLHKLSEKTKFKNNKYYKKKKKNFNKNKYKN